MPSTPVKLGDPIPLSLTAHDGATGLYPQAHVYDEAGVEDGSSPYDLTEVGATGRYTSAAMTPATEETFVALFVVYTDAIHTLESVLHGRVDEQYPVSGLVDDVDTILTRVDVTISTALTALEAHGDTTWATAVVAGLATSAEIAALEAHGDLTWATAVGFAIAGDAMTLTAGERTTLTAVIDAALSLAHGSGAWDGLPSATAIRDAVYGATFGSYDAANTFGWLLNTLRMGLTNRIWEDPVADTLTLFDDGDVAARMTWALTDKDGNSINGAVGAPARRAKGV